MSVMSPCTFLVTAVVTGKDANVSVMQKAKQVWRASGIRVSSSPPLIHSLTYSTDSLIRSLADSFTHSFAHSLTHSLIQSLTHSFTRSLTYSFTRSLTYSFTLHSLIHSLFTHLFIHSFTTSQTAIMAPCLQVHQVKPVIQLLGADPAGSICSRLSPFSSRCVAERKNGFHKFSC